MHDKGTIKQAKKQKNFDFSEREYLEGHQFPPYINHRHTMIKLNLPEAQLKLKREDNRMYVWDYIRLRWVILTPEEWVRQHFSHWMTEGLGYPKERMGHEISLEQNGMQRRADAVFYDQNGNPQIILEFKAPHISISQKTFNQISRYNMVMQVPLLIVSNGIQHFCMRIHGTQAEYLPEIPKY